MRTIRSISLTSLVLIALSGVGSYIVTKNLQDPRSSTGLLFALAWAFSSFGVAIATTIICSMVGSKSYGKRGFIGELFGFVSGMFIFIAIVEGIVAGVTSSYDIPGDTSGDIHEDAARFACIFVATLAGLVIGFFGILLVNAKDEWSGSVDKIATNVDENAGDSNESSQLRSA